MSVQNRLACDGPDCLVWHPIGRQEAGLENPVQPETWLYLKIYPPRTSAVMRHFHCGRCLVRWVCDYFTLSPPTPGSHHVVHQHVDGCADA